MHTRSVQTWCAAQSVASQHAAFGMHALPHCLCVLAHSNPQRWPSQLALPSGGAAHGEHAIPQPFTLSFGTHTPEQLCVPVGHLPVQAASAGMQLPAHACCPVGHLA
ncbi:MAG TPA: hypothetical protein VJR89_00090 [Polyangiales bacterium]|nr:hypothetical protein [Polyangiales bacterium]